MPKITFSFTQYTKPSKTPGIIMARCIDARIDIHNPEIDLTKIPDRDFKDCGYKTVKNQWIKLNPTYTHTVNINDVRNVQHFTFEIDEDKVVATKTPPRTVTTVQQSNVDLHFMRHIADTLQQYKIISNKVKTQLTDGAITLPHQYESISFNAPIEMTSAHPALAPLIELPYSGLNQENPRKLEPGSWWLDPGNEYILRFSFVNPEGQIVCTPFPRFVGDISKHLEDLQNWAAGESSRYEDYNSMNFNAKKCKWDETNKLWLIKIVKPEVVFGIDLLGNKSEGHTVFKAHGDGTFDIATIVEAVPLVGYPIEEHASQPLDDAIQRAHDNLTAFYHLPNRFFKPRPIQKALNDTTRLPKNCVDEITSFLTSDEGATFSVIRKK
ncbi:MAG TPA: hypothetical protein VHA52_07535 [Candidatus Babeliaceae bacterium]|nr:hypothetical protein [Candidatus Babeliaceae bacterium]